MSNHTPGPWRLLPRRESDNTIGISAGRRLSPLAYVCPRPLFDDTQDANARLIAAAPEMLAVLEALEQWGGDMAGEFYADGHGAAVRAILAKARGETQ